MFNKKLTLTLLTVSFLHTFYYCAFQLSRDSANKKFWILCLEARLKNKWLMFIEFRETTEVITGLSTTVPDLVGPHSIFRWLFNCETPIIIWRGWHLKNYRISRNLKNSWYWGTKNYDIERNEIAIGSNVIHACLVSSRPWRVLHNINTHIVGYM
jgi:hypothetical protein